jgi:uncharacterized BrkB/YihY/UPF0761 family membrane protein
VTRNGWISRTRRRVDATRERIIALRPRSAGVDTTLSAIERDRERAGRLLAGALAHRLFLWLLPFTLVVVAGLGFLEASSRDGPRDFSEHVGIVGIASQSISRAADDAEHTRFFALLIGLPALYLGSVGAIKAFRTVSALAWGVPDDRKWNRPLNVLGFLALLVVAFGVLMTGTALRHASPGPGVIATVLAIFGFVAIAFLALWVLPHPAVPWTAILPGAVLLGFGLEAIHLLTVYFISYKVSTSSETYGALGVAAGLLLSLYVVGRLFVASLILNVTLWERDHPRPSAGPGYPQGEAQSPVQGDATSTGARHPPEAAS